MVLVYAVRNRSLSYFFFLLTNAAEPASISVTAASAGAVEPVLGDEVDAFVVEAAVVLFEAVVVVFAPVVEAVEAVVVSGTGSSLL